MPGIYTPDATVVTKPADDDWISIAAAELRTLKSYLASSFVSKNTGTAVQSVYFQTGAVATGSATIPNDDTIPQITEGTQFMSLAITPKNALNILEVEVVFFGVEATNTSDGIIVALFKDSDAPAIAAGSQSSAGTLPVPSLVTFKHRQVAGGTAEQTFKVRAGLDAAGTIVFNGGSGTGRKFGGVIASSIKITEYVP